MAPRILFELFNATLPAGTGIATYAQNVCSLARDLGYACEGLLHTNRQIPVKDPVLAEVSFFDARNRTPDRFHYHTHAAYRRLFGLPLGLNARPLPLGSFVAHTEVEKRLAGLSRLYSAPLFMDATRYHFKRYGRCATLKLRDTPDIFHATQALPLRVAGAANVYTIHDVVPLKMPQTTLDDKPYFLNMVRHLGKSADHIVTVSDASRRDLISLGIDPGQITTTYQSVSLPPEVAAQSYEEAARLVENAFGLRPREYYLFYGALEPKKNVSRLLDAYGASGSRRPLILAGGLGWDYEKDLAKLKALQSRSRRVDGGLDDEKVRRLDYLPFFQLGALIRCARAVLFPSLYEGFGLPVLEAMLLGTPVMTSNLSSLPEVAGDAALLVDPVDTHDIMAALSRLDADEDLCAVLRARGPNQAIRFSPAAHKEKLGRVYDAVREKRARLTRAA